MSEPDPDKEIYRITAKLPLSTYLSFVHAAYPRVDHILGGLAARKKNAGSETQLLQALRQAKAEALREAIEDWLAKQNMQLLFPIEERKAALWEVVQELAAESTTYWDDPSGERMCLFCNSTPSREYREGVRHEESCLVMRARRLVKTKEKQGE